MKIRLMSDKYELSGDSSQFILAEVKVKKAGKVAGKQVKEENIGDEYLTNHKYMCTLDQVLRYIFNNETRTNEAETLEELFEIVKKTHKDIAEMKELMYSIVE